MKHIGIVGITSEGAAECFRTICSEAAARAGAHKHPEITMHIRSFDQILAAQEERNWNRVAGFVLESIRTLQESGAEFAIIPANSVHFALPVVRQKSPIPVLSIVEETADECMRQGYKRAAVLGVGFTMSGGLYADALSDRGIEHVLPPVGDQEHLSRIIYEEIVPAKVTEKGMERLLKIVSKLKDQDCDVAILACTELPLVLNEKNCALPLVNSTRVLALKAVEESLA